MNLKKYLDSLPMGARAKLAKKVGTNAAYITQLVGKFRAPSWKMAIAIEKATKGEVKRSDLRPDIYPPA